MSMDYQHSILWRGEDPSKRKFVPKYDGGKKVARLRAGQIPEWAKGREDEEDEDIPKKKKLAVRQDPRMARLAAAAGQVPDVSDRIQQRRALQRARVLEALVEEEEEKARKAEDEDKLKATKVEDFDDDPESKPPVMELKFQDLESAAGEEELRSLRRERAKALAAMKQQDVMAKEEENNEEEDEDDEEGESEDASDSEEENDPRRRAMLKPFFVPKAQRDTLKEKAALEEEELAMEERRKARVKERKVDSKVMAVDQIKADDEAEKEAAMDDNSDIELLDDDDEKNEAEEYELWKIRELKRIKRDKEERVTRDKEIELIERRRRMSDAEREEDDRRLDIGANKKDEAKSFGFMQKYYHRGGFFQDKAQKGDEPLYLRDFHEPLDSEKYDKNLLPKAMQLRRGQFGKKGQVKHTHLTDADTTDMSAAWAQSSKQVQRYQERMATAKGVESFARPSGKSAGSRD